jgi:hypothetical protein
MEGEVKEGAVVEVEEEEEGQQGDLDYFDYSILK